MKFFYITVLCLLNSTLISQKYFSEIIPFPFGNPTITGLYSIDNSYVIPIIYPDSISTIIIYNNEEVEYKHISNFDFSRQPLTIIDESVFMYAKDRLKSKSLKLNKLDMTFSPTWTKEIETLGEYNFPTSSKALQNNIYNTFFYLDEDNVYHIGINKCDKNGNTVWTKYYEDNIGYSYIWDIVPSFSEDLVCTYTIRYNGQTKGYPSTIKIDTSGQIIWKSLQTETISNGAAPIWITQLSDSNFVQIYKVNKSQDQEFTINDWSPFPYRFRWIDKDGIPVKERLDIVHGNDNVIYSQIETGKGDYFYTYGENNEDGPATNVIDNTYHALLTKYNNNGDTLWTRKYRHPDYDSIRIHHLIKDIEELDNGDIVILASITPPQQESKIWLYRVDAQGCYKDEPCSDIIITDVEEVTLDDKAQALVYPNPVTDKLSVSYTDRLIKEISIYSLAGKLVYNRHVKTHYHTIDMESFETGLYLMELTDEYGITETIKIVKQ